MLPVDLVRARRDKGRLVVTPLGKGAPRALELAEELVAIAEEHVDRTRDELAAAWRALDVSPREVRLRDGLAALVEDELVFGAPVSVEPASLRADVFTRAAAARREGSFDRGALLDEAARERGIERAAIEDALYADLRGAERLRASARGALVPGGARAIVERYDVAQVQAVLLRATQVVVTLRGASPLALRALLRKLKFHRLLFTAERASGEIRLTLDGPSALFESTTRYGLALALAMPSVLACRPERVEARLRWGKERQPLDFVLERTSPLLEFVADREEAAVLDEVATLAERLRKKSTRWDVSIAELVLDVPGLGIVVPDLTLRELVGERGRGASVHVELLGHWSRDAVFHRVELAERGLSEPILFCVSERLRVSEAVLPEETGASLYVYKGVPSASAVLERVERLAPRGRSR